MTEEMWRWLVLLCLAVLAAFVGFQHGRLLRTRQELAHFKLFACAVWEREALEKTWAIARRLKIPFELSDSFEDLHVRIQDELAKRKADREHAGLGEKA